jgi:hypothetical protein
MQTSVNLSGGLGSLVEGVRIGVVIGSWIDDASVIEGLCVSTGSDAGSVTCEDSCSGLSCMPSPAWSAGIMLCDLGAVSDKMVDTPSHGCVSDVGTET